MLHLSYETTTAKQLLHYVKLPPRDYRQVAKRQCEVIKLLILACDDK